MNSILPFPRLRALAIVAGLGIIAAESHAQSLLLHYDFNQSTGTTVVDRATNPANGTLTGAGSTWTAMPSGFNATYAYSNSGANGTYITAGDVAKLDGLGNFTISGWINVTEASVATFAQDRVASKRGSSGAFFDLRFNDLGDGAIGLSLEINTTVGSALAVSSTAMDMSGWFFFAVTRDATTGEVSFYYGTPDGAFSAAGSGIGRAGTIPDSTAAFMIGNTAANTQRAPNAAFSDFRIYDDVLTTSALKNIQYAALPIPEPGSLSLLAFSGAALAWYRRRSAKAPLS